MNPADYRIGGVIDPSKYGVFMPPGNTAEGKPMRDALLVIKPGNLGPLQVALEKEAVLGVVAVMEPLAIVGFELLSARLRIQATSERWGLVVLVGHAYQAQTLAVFAHAVAKAQEWPDLMANRLVLPAEVADA